MNVLLYQLLRVITFVPDQHFIYCLRFLQRSQ